MKFTREVYKKIKAMDRKTMETFITETYNAGVEKGVGMSVRPEQINEIIKNTKGVGETKRKAIMEQVTQLFE